VQIEINKAVKQEATDRSDRRSVNTPRKMPLLGRKLLSRIAK
jgi:hypothetical protein